MKITKIDLNNKIYGGRIYENQIIDLLNNEINVERIFLLKYRIKILNIPRIIWLFIKYHFSFKGTLLLTNQTTWLAGRQAHNIVIIHHLDSSFSDNLSNKYQSFCEKALYRNRKLFSTVVTVAKCWKEQLQKKGFKNVIVIYNSFNPNLYKFSSHEIQAFKEKHNLLNKPLIYLGNCQKKKGVVEAYNALKSMDVLFVTSGNKDVELPLPNLNLSFEDYRLLLASSDIVITMSQFKEGWNRTAHEAILSGTPVIGSGSGGMEELLILSNQIICKSFNDLPQFVDMVLKKEIIDYDTFLETFNIAYFKQSWKNVFFRISGDES